MSGEPSAREEVLRRVRVASAGAPAPTIARDYQGAGERAVPDPIALCAERIADYRATVRVATAATAPAVIAELLAGRGRVVVPAGFPEQLLAACSFADVLRDEPPLTPAQLDGADAVVTTCRCAIALTGTIVLDHGAGQGRRALTLLPDHHLVVLPAERVVVGVPDAIAVLADGALADALTWISGPSATSDIELERVEGVHGPRRLDVVIVVG